VLSWKCDDDIAAGNDQNVARVSETTRNDHIQPLIRGAGIVRGQNTDGESARIVGTPRRRLHHSAETTADQYGASARDLPADFFSQLTHGLGTRACTTHCNVNPSLCHRLSHIHRIVRMHRVHSERARASRACPSGLRVGLALRAKSGNRRTMKRPIAEFLVITLNAGSEAEQARAEHEAWQILRRKQGYVTHRLYQQLDNPLAHLVYSEWESTKAVDGARQHLQGTPLMRRARATLAGPPQRLLFEISGPITSTKGLDLGDTAVAASGVARLKAPSDSWRLTEQKLWALLASQPGHITHILLRGIGNPLVVGSVSHWADSAAFQTALAQVDGAVGAAAAEALAGPVDYVQYKLLRD